MHKRHSQCMHASKRTSSPKGPDQRPKRVKPPQNKVYAKGGVCDQPKRKGESRLWRKWNEHQRGVTPHATLISQPTSSRQMRARVSWTRTIVGSTKKPRLRCAGRPPPARTSQPSSTAPAIKASTAQREKGKVGERVMRVCACVYDCVCVCVFACVCV